MLPVPLKKSKKARGGRSLNEADWVFIQSYLKHGNATKAYHDAGFNGNNPGFNAYKMLHKAGIQEVLRLAKEKAVTRVAKKLEVTVDKVLGDLEDARVIALKAQPAPQCSAAIKASELQGRHIGMFRDDDGEREKIPVIRMEFNQGSQVAIIGKQEMALTGPQLTTHLPPPTVDEVLTDDDLL